MNNITKVGKACCGCSACEQLCPRKCIKLEYDNEGFLYPRVDEKLCTECGFCVNHCPVAVEVKRGSKPEVLAVKYKDRESVINSTSGGVFVPLALKTLEKGGAVFGCAYDENLVARHIAIESKSELKRLQGSKYVQSDVRGIYKAVKRELENGREVLFSGTCCQTAGLRAFLGKDYQKLLLVDIVCHGVPSPKLFAKYIDYMGKRLGGRLISYDFRCKKKRGWDLYYKATTEKKSKSDYGFFDPYYNAFLTCKTYRESCYSCKFANSERTGDITLADYWGIKNEHPGFYDINGVSLVLLNSERGRRAWSEIKDSVTAIPSTLEQAVRMNENLVAPSNRPTCRDDIYKGIDGDFDEYINEKLKFKINPKTRLKKMVPLWVKRIFN